MTREQYIEQIRRMIYGGQPDDDAEITVNLVNQWLDQAIGVAAQKNYTDTAKLDGIAYINNSFYSTFKNLSVTKDSPFTWKVNLPHVPYGIGTSKGLERLVFKDPENNQLSFNVVWMSQAQTSFYDGMRPIPNHVLAYSEGDNIFIKSTVKLSDYTAQVTMVSGGDSTDLASTLNVPGDYLPVVTEYLKNQFMFERNVPKDVTHDGLDAIRTT